MASELWCESAPPASGAAGRVPPTCFRDGRARWAGRATLLGAGAAFVLSPEWGLSRCRIFRHPCRPLARAGLRAPAALGAALCLPPGVRFLLGCTSFRGSVSLSGLESTEVHLVSTVSVTMCKAGNHVQQVSMQI